MSGMRRGGCGRRRVVGSAFLGGCASGIFSFFFSFRIGIGVCGVFVVVVVVAVAFCGVVYLKDSCVGRYGFAGSVDERLCSGGELFG